jgi:hypothetical protein
MNTDTLVTQFEKAGLELVIAKEPIVGGLRINRRGAPPPTVEIIQLDIKRKFKGNARSEYFLLWPGHADNLVQVLGTDKELGQVVLLLKEPKRDFVEVLPSHAVKEFNKVGKDVYCKRYGVQPRDLFVKNGDLCHKRTTTGRAVYVLAGRDERQLFQTQLSGPCTSVKQAHDMLKGNTVYMAEGKVGKAVRQGEWFFLMPTKEEQLAIDNVLKKKLAVIGKKVPIGQRLGRTGGKPHTADEMLILPGSRLEHGFAVRTNEVFIKGKVTHADHKTVEFSSWRKVIGNTESRISASIGGGTWVD